jgi:endonuclease/exonuclease/phosphatase (EEP) superfamily protein YafD
MIDIVVYILGSIMITATAIPLLRSEAWWVRVFDFPRLQILVIGCLVLILSILFVETNLIWDLTFNGIFFAALTYQSYMMFPYTRLARHQVQQSTSADPDSSIRILFANVLMTNRDASKIKQIIEGADPDIVLLVEPDEWWREQMSALECEYPHTVQHALNNTYGMLLYSRLELLDPEVTFLIHNDVPSIRGRVRLRNGQDVQFRCLHPRPPVPQEADSSLPRDAEILIVGKENQQDDMPFIVFGDLNDVAWSSTNYAFQNVSGLLDPRIGRGFYHTFHARIPFLRFPLDHFFHSNHFRLVSFRRLGYFGSDHFPVFIELSLEPDAANVQAELRPDRDEIIEAEQKIDDALTEAG